MRSYVPSMPRQLPKMSSWLPPSLGISTSHFAAAFGTMTAGTRVFGCCWSELLPLWNIRGRRAEPPRTEAAVCYYMLEGRAVTCSALRRAPEALNKLQCNPTISAASDDTAVLRLLRADGILKGDKTQQCSGTALFARLDEARIHFRAAFQQSVGEGAKQQNLPGIRSRAMHSSPYRQYKHHFIC